MTKYINKNRLVHAYILRSYGTHATRNSLKLFHNLLLYKLFFRYDKNNRIISKFNFYQFKGDIKLKACFIGYLIPPKYRNLGIATNELRKLVKFLTNTKRFKDIYARVSKTEYGMISAKVLEKNNFSFLGEYKNDNYYIKSI